VRRFQHLLRELGLQMCHAFGETEEILGAQEESPRGPPGPAEAERLAKPPLCVKRVVAC